MRHSFDNLQKFSFVPADASHYRLIADFLTATRGPEDHIRFLLEDMLKPDSDQKIVHVNLMALLSGEVVGFLYCVLFPGYHDSGGGLTVEPQFRKMGLARHFFEIREEIVRQHNIGVIKGIVTSWNVPIFKKLGHVKAGLWHISGCGFGGVKAGAASLKSSGVRPAVDSDLEALEKFLLKSDHYNSCDRMYVEDLTWYPLDGLWLADFIKQGKVLLSEDGSGIRGWAIINKKSLINPFPDGSFPIMEIGYFDGDWTAILDFIRENYRPDFLRIYSANGIPLKCLPAEIKMGYPSKFNNLYGELRHLKLSAERLFFSPVMIMQKIISN